MKYPFKGLSKKQKQILNEIGVGNYSLSSVFPTKQAISGLLEKGLIGQVGFKLLGGDRFGAIRVPEYCMPMEAHILWTQYQAGEYDKENPSIESGVEK